MASCRRALLQEGMSLWQTHLEIRRAGIDPLRDFLQNDSSVSFGRCFVANVLIACTQAS
jgi:hypothetical protein